MDRASRQWKPPGPRDRPARIAIDGPAGSGKSTLARELAERLDLPYVNTGLMYRALARRALDEGVEPSEGQALERIARGFAFSLGPEEAGGPPELLIDGAPTGPDLRAEDVERIVSTTSAHPRVRSVLGDEQRRLAEGGAVMEGRDIGTVVLPDADVKIYLDARAEVRVERRELERVEADGVAEALERRDRRDARVNPLEPAEDAVVIDSSSLAADQVVDVALEVIRERTGLTGKTVDGRGEVEEAIVPRVVVVGRQNVGKSTLVNRLLGRKEAIEAEEPGVTRDRLEHLVRWRGSDVILVDTGGYVHRARDIESKVSEQAERARAEADLILLVVDVQTGVQEEDAALARALRRAPAPVVVVVNKVDSDRAELRVPEFLALGLGDPIPVSALHGRGSADLLDRIVDLVPSVKARPQPDDEIRAVLIGRPNVGKSSIFNHMVGQDRSVVHELAGTTRDTVDSTLRWGDRTIRFVDTAGLRREVKTQGVEYYGLLRSRRALEAAQVAVLIVDASEGLTSEDKRIAAAVAEAGKGLVAVLNKWDLVPSEFRRDLFVDLQHELAIFPGTPVLRTSALTGRGVDRVLPELLRVHEAWTRRVPTSDVNRVLEAATSSNPPPRGVGSIRYGTQVAAGPPTFVLFGTASPPAASYRRYLEHTLRDAFGFDGVPIRLAFRTRPRRARAGRHAAR
jgi:GTP-binding protein